MPLTEALNVLVPKPVEVSSTRLADNDENSMRKR
jgi:hypothetical protein